MRVTKEEILKAFRKTSYRPLRMREMFVTFKVPKEDRRAFKRLIKELLKDGEIIKTRKNQYGLPTYPTPARGSEGRPVKVLCRPDDPRSITDMIIEEYGLPRGFREDLLREARSIPQDVTRMDIKGRKDLRKINTVTIDGEMARDFDDAISIRSLPKGSILLLVHIADVSHYLPWDSPLDKEARVRGTSVYFPDRVIPMLPIELSNGICSLNPREDRLAVTIEMEFDKEGNRLRYDFYDSVINSNERMTYTSLKKILVDKDPSESRRYHYLLDDFRIMEELCLRLGAKRMQRGSLDFDLPEPEIVLDLRGEIKDILIAERNIAHRIIEEFMIAANETVACYMAMQKVPFIYRIHEEPDPDKMEELLDFLRGFGFQITKKRVHPKVLQKVLREVRDMPEERVINSMILRSMKQARYSAENHGHFGLASQCYTHFTSPIRRYPDLIAHRLLKELRKGHLSERRKGYLEGVLPEIAVHSSERERIADEAEREVVKLLKLRFMKDKVGEEYEGIITGVTSYGIFVQLKEIFVEGLVHISTLRDDYYRFNEGSHLLKGKYRKKVFRIGDEIRVRIDRVDIERRQIDFSLIK